MNLFPSLSVSDFVSQIRDAIETEFPTCWITGEIGQVTKASSGHIYFSIKDAKSSVRAVMWRAKAFSFQGLIREGAEVDILARPSLYEPRGEFQLIVEAVRTTGVGFLYERFLQLKEKLTLEGLFDPDKKRPIPAWPETVGIITSPQAAALADVLITFKRRNPTIPLILYPTPVQGEEARLTIVDRILKANQRRECDVLLLCRGGGSFEDLNIFNDENIARVIASSNIPVVTGIGHEVDVTIADYVADYRAATPTAAAEKLSPSIVDAQMDLAQLLYRSKHALINLSHRYENRLDRLMLRLSPPQTKIEHQHRRLKNHLSSLHQTIHRHYYLTSHQHQRLIERLWRTRPNPLLAEKKLHSSIQTFKNQMKLHLIDQQSHLSQHIKALSALNPLEVLSRGYSITYDENGHIIRHLSQLAKGRPITTQLASGKFTSQVEEIVQTNANRSTKKR